ncbi:unnamed protein product, partial [marine sediment metagenome]
RQNEAIAPRAYDGCALAQGSSDSGNDSQGG